MTAERIVGHYPVIENVIYFATVFDQLSDKVDYRYVGMLYWLFVPLYFVQAVLRLIFILNIQK